MEVLGTPTAPSPDSIPVQMASATPSPNPDLTATPIPLPATSAPTPEPTSQGNISEHPEPPVRQIVFSHNATVQSVPGGLDAGESLTYSLNAFQGQVMSVSIHTQQPESQNSFQLEIKGRDGVVLCPIENYGCPFWRGSLPSTQEYFITVSSQVSDLYSMEVAINPIGTANQYFTHSDPLGRFTLSFSDEFSYANYPGAQVYKFRPELVLQYIDTPQYIPTNLSEAYFMIGISDDSRQITTCTEPASISGTETNVGEVNINGISYTRSEVQGAAAGNIYEVIYHRTVQNDRCYEVIYFMHYGNIDNYVPGEVKEFDRAALLQKFEDILATVIYK
jgi:hypothetical protein